MSEQPTIEELVRRVEAMEEAVERMLGAFREDLASLRAELQRLGTSPPLRTPSRTPSRPQTPSSAPRRTISEEVRLSEKKDPRADDD